MLLDSKALKLMLHTLVGFLTVKYPFGLVISNTQFYLRFKDMIFSTFLNPTPLHAIQKHKFFHIFKSPFFSNSLK